jgi:hypothetical protein
MHDSNYWLHSNADWLNDSCLCGTGMYILIISTLKPIIRMFAKGTSETASWVKEEWTYFLFHVGLLKYKTQQKVNGI